MKYNRIIGTAAIFLVLGTTLPAFAQKGEEQKGGGGRPQAAQRQAEPQRSQPAAHQAAPQRAQAVPQQHAERAAPQRAQATPQRAQETRQAAPQRAQATQRQAAPQRSQSYSSNRGGGQYGRISNANYSSHFGHDHSFHVGRPEFVGGYNRFQYGGYSFGYNEGWPVGWGYDDNCYVVYEDGGYFLYDMMHPGIHISLSIF